MSEAPLRCPTCAVRYEADQRFCPDCSMPLVPADGPAEEPAGDSTRERARKIRPEYTRGDVVRVAASRNQSEAEMIQFLLLDEGVPSVLRRSAGFDVPEFLASGPRDVMVPASGAGAARALLVEAGLTPPLKPRGAPHARGGHAARLALAVSGGGLAAALLAWALLRLPL